MSDWSAGYVSDVDYTYGYYKELCPLSLEIAMLHAGLASPNIETACELGFGQGLSTNIHAAASNIDWYGTDFNPAQAAFARDLASASGAPNNLYDESFLEFCSRDDLPDFDFIGLHGIWSWISDDNRKIIVDFVRRKLRVGGVLYVSYNTLPGWASFAPMRHLLTQHAEIIGSEGSGIVSRIDGALDFADKFLATKPLYAVANPNIDERIKKVSEQNRHYLAHEYFNKDWDPMHFATMAQWLEPSKVDFACSAHVLDHFDAVNMSDEQTNFLNEIPDLMLRQSTRDFIINQQFRRDIWVKGLRRMSSLEKQEKFLTKKFLLVVPRDSITLKVTGSQGEASMNESIYNPVLDALADHQAITVGDLLKKVSSKEINLPKLVESLMILTSTGQVLPVQNPQLAAKLKPRTDRLNDYLINKARSGGDISYLASPVTGSGTSLTRFDQLFVGSVKAGKSNPEEMAKIVWNVLNAQGQKIVKEGAHLAQDAENIAELKSQAEEFVAKRLPILKAALVV